MKSKKFILWFNETDKRDVPLVGGKNASLGEMYQKLTKRGANIPNGFSITAYAYRHLLKKEKLEKKLREILRGVNNKHVKELYKRGALARRLIRNAKFPEELNEAITKAYKQLCRQYGRDTDVAVRSSATAEDLPSASFAGQQETFLNIRGERALLAACKRCFASLFTNRAISYREDKGFDHFKIALSIGVQKMVRSDLAGSGVMFSIDTESGFKDVVFINASYGLGENIVQGKVNPDGYYVFKPLLNGKYKPIISKSLGNKRIKMIYTKSKSRPIKNINVSVKDRNKFAMSDDEILKLAKWACIIEQHYKMPMDMEWAKDGKTKKLFIVQARPETVQSQKRKGVLEEYYLKQKGPLIVEGYAVGDKIGQGAANLIHSMDDLKNFKKGQVLVTGMTNPDMEPVMKIASGIVTDRGGKTCHAAIVSRELGIPCIVGTNNATTKIRQNQKVTVSCAEGEVGYVYNGLLKFGIKKYNLKKFPKTKTRVMMNVGNPEQAFEFSFIPNSGVGLAREEFIINSYIKIHPLALLNYNKIRNKSIKNKINELTLAYKNKSQFFVDKLAWGIARIAAAFYPKDVIVRTSDFKSNEYANLIGGKDYEPKEDNPMIGWRGASRYYSKKYEKAFALECKAFKKAREEFGLKNIKIMIPFCRTVEEGKRVLEVMEKNGLKQGRDGLEVYVMCEIPSNVILAEQFAKIFDGFSIGTNDLTQLTLGLDRDSELVADLYDERNLAVKRLVGEVIRVARKNKRKIGICGEAAAIPEFAEFLVDCGINSVSVNPDSVVKTTLTVANKEKKLRRK